MRQILALREQRRPARSDAAAILAESPAGAETASSGDDTRLGAFWRANLVAWLSLALVTAFMRATFYDSASTTLLLTATLDPAGFAYTSVLHLIYRRLVGRPNKAMTAVVYASLLGLVGGFGQMLLANLVRGITHGFFLESHGGPLITLIFYTAIFGGWSIAYFWIAARSAVRAERLRRTEAEAAALRAELDQLQTQLDPHFLFNALNTIAAEIPERPETAVELTRAVSTHLRERLEHSGQSLWPLSDEIAHVRSYLQIQTLRYDKRLDSELDIASGALRLVLPCLVVQELTENAVKHGRKSPTGRLLVRVTARLQGETLAIEVANYGCYEPSAGNGKGLGIENMRRRLEIHYPHRHLFGIDQVGQTVVARLLLQGPPCFA